MRLATVSAAAVLALAVTAPAHAGAPRAAPPPDPPGGARWELAEQPGEREMADSSGNGLVGTVGGDVGVGTRFGSVSSPASGYRFPVVAPDELPVRPGHTVVVPDDDRLDPGTADWVVEVRLRAAGPDGNVLQKGQSGSPRGFWKVELNSGEPTCLFRGPRGTNAVRARGVPVDDGSFHTVRCERTAEAVDLWVDGRHVGRNTGPTGPIRNNQPLSVGGKQRCDQLSVGCDYFSGDLDWVSITTP